LKEKKFDIPGREEEEKQQQQKKKEEILIDSLLGRGTQVTTRKESWHGVATVSSSAVAVATVAGTTLDQCAKDLQSTGPPRVLQLSRTLRGRGRGECRQQ
jgi:NAD(P)H-hydrate repair Nnr-like enzyme with NAD(P)H-hydrate epimerase domain